MRLEGIDTLHLEQEADGAVLVLRFDHGKANEIGSRQLVELERLAAHLEADGGTRALLTYSARVSEKGTPIFVSGADVTERVGWDDARIKEHVRWQRAVLARLRRAPVLHVVVVQGVAFGWGTEFLLTADYRLACPGARFALPETGLGILPGAGGTSELQAEIGPAQALRLGLTGEVIDAAEALSIGLVQEVLPDPAAALARARALARMAATRSPTANAAFKAALLSSIGAPGARRASLEARAYEVCVDAGEAARGRAGFAAARRGAPVAWGPRVSPDVGDPDDT